MTTEETRQPLDFIRQTIEDDLKSGKHESIVTRFPPEPNGYLHIGHAKSICLNFGIAREYQGKCHLRFDDTNPIKEDVEYVDSIQEDVRWLGGDWGDDLFYASDYFGRLYEFAVELIQKGKAFVDDQSQEEIQKQKGTATAPGVNSPNRDRTVEENLGLFEKMKAGEFDPGTHVLRAKIDMKSPNLVMRDPVIYRILKVDDHHRTGGEWCIYPMYDFTHCLSDSIEGITHSLCTTEFEIRRPLYEWVLAQLDVPSHPVQTEFARLNVTHTVTSKRKLHELVDGGQVSGWDDPRMPTIGGLRRRGYTPSAIRAFCDKIGVAKRENTIEVALLEHCLRDELNKSAQRVMGVLRPLKLVITNCPEGEIDELEAVNNPEDESAGKRMVPFSRELWIEKTDFMEDAPKKFFRLAPGREVRLRYAYLVTCTDVVKDAAGEVVEVHCTYDPETRGGNAPDGRKVKGTIHWVSAQHALDAEVRLYDHLFTAEDPSDVEEGQDWKDYLNPNSLEVLTDAKVEPFLADAKPGSLTQFERHGYFCVDAIDSSAEKLVFNRTTSLRDSWKKIAKKG